MVSFKWPWNKASRYERDLAAFAAASQPPSAAKPRPRSGQVAPLSSDPLRLADSYLGISANTDSNLRHQSPRDFEYDYPYGIYEEPLDKDPLLRGLRKQRNGALLSKQWRLLPPVSRGNSDYALALDIAAFCEAALRQMPQLRSARKQFNDAWYWGNVYGNVVWHDAPSELRYECPVPAGPGQRGLTRAVTRSGCWLPRQIRIRHPRRWQYTPEGELRLMDGYDLRGEAVPPFTMLVQRRELRFDDEYGAGDARPIWWWTKFKADGIRWLLYFLERWPLPKPLLKHPEDPSPAELANWRKIVTSLQSQTGLTLPQSVELELLEIASAAGSDLYTKFAEYCDKQITLCALSVTLTTQQGEKGARSLGEVHLVIRNEVIADDAEDEAELLAELLRWIVMFNFGANRLHLTPLWHVEVEPPADSDSALERFVAALAAGVDVSEEQLREECNIYAPSDASDSLLQRREERAARMFRPGDPQEDQTEEGAAPAPDDASPPARARALELELLQLPTGRLAAAAGPEQLPPALLPLYTSGVQAASAVLADLPDELRRQFEQLAAGRLGDDWASQPLRPALLSGWERELEFAAQWRSGFIEQLNDDLSIAALLAREAAATRARAATALPVLRAQGPSAAPQPGDSNPAAAGLFDLPRILPRRVLDVLQRKTLESLSFEQFYQLDALARASAFTAWDLLEADVRHLGAALEDAAREGWTVQQFADYVYDRLEARYVSQGSSLHAWHVETIYHTNLAVAYNHAQLDEVWELREIFPAIQFVNPDPQFETCRYCAGKVWPTEDPVWRSFTPPLHFNCGSTTLALTREALTQQGLTVELQEPPYSPEKYPGPRNPASGQPAGSPQPFGAWAPLAERYAHLQQVRGGQQ